MPSGSAGASGAASSGAASSGAAAGVVVAAGFAVSPLLLEEARSQPGAIREAMAAAATSADRRMRDMGGLMA